ncbi:MAG: hypothetical protein ACRD2A_06930 [Vicinamibacterales bacterium]
MPTEKNVRRKAVWGAAMICGVSTLLLTSCGSQVREGEASSYLVIQSLEGSSGAEPGEFGNPVFSDVQTFVNDEDIPCCPTFFNDLGQAVFRLVMKDPGTAGSPTTPTPNNWITLTQYRVTFFRTDGRNTPGVDVPHGFDGAITATVREETTVSFDLVRNAAKLDAPLRALRFGGGANLIHAIAEITFFGHDQTGREVSVTGRINIHFGDFGDPE